MKQRFTEIFSNRPGFVRTGRGWHRQVKLQGRTKGKGKRK